MPVIDDLCPRCGADPKEVDGQGSEYGAPPEGSIFTCSRCNFLGIWDTHYWRTPSDAERLALLHNDAVLNAMTVPLLLSLHQMADAEHMTRLLAAVLCAWKVNPNTPIDKVILAMVTTLQGAGFHTHTDPLEWPEGRGATS
jgi:hypothetical protein